MILIPNILSLLRILFVPLILWLIILELYFIAAISITIVGITDWLDGYIARKFHSETVIGFYLDAVADKVLIVTIYLLLGIKLLLPLYLLILIVFREILISGSYLFGLALKIKHSLRPIFISKVNTFFQILLLIFICLTSIHDLEELNYFIIIKNILIIIVIITTFISSLTYIFLWVKEVNN